MSVDIIDRVYDAYTGELGQRFMRDTQQRIHWICSVVRGASVLDVGSSQGLLPILLGREGQTAVGIDSHAGSVRSAEQHLSTEPPMVRRLVTFIEGDFSTQSFDSDRFDCIVMGEVLEHLVQPERFVERAAQLLSPGGKLVITVPFGVNDHVDHKHTYYFREPCRLVSSHFDVVDVELLGKWLGIVAVRRGAESISASTWNDRDLARLEEAFERVERSLLDEVSNLRSRLDDANVKYRSSTEEVARLKREAAHHEAERKSAERERNALEARLKHNEPLTEREQLRAEVERQRESRHESELAVARLEERLGRAEERQTLELRIKDVEAARLLAEHSGVLLQLQQERSKTDAEAQSRARAELCLEMARAEHSRAEQRLLDQVRAEEQAHIATQHTLQALEAALATARAELAATEGSLQATDAELATVQQQHADASARIDELAEALARSSSAGEIQATRILALESDIAQLRLRESEQARSIAEQEARLVHTQTLLQNERRGSSQSIAEWGQEKQELQRTREVIADHERTSASQRVLLRAAESKAEQLKKELEASRAGERRARAEIEVERRERSNAERKVVQTRNTLSFQLGYELIHGFKSRRALTELPGNLWHLQQEAARRRREKDGKHRVPVRQIALDADRPKSREAPPSAQPAAAPQSAAAATSAPAIIRRVPKELRALKIACVHDEFTFSSFAPECQLLQLTPAAWQSELERFAPDLLFVESAWRGKDELWTRKVAHRSQELIDMVAWCKGRGIPTVFWNKEDPVHFRTFLNTAKLFDFVFTTDVDCLPAYKRALGHDRVQLLPFAVQPKAHNPIEKYARKEAVAFAGAYYAKYPERQVDLASFVDAFSENPRLEIFDRNYGKTDPDYQFPDRYQAHIVGTLPFDQIDKAYKGFRYALNLNSIKGSQTMFARRVFELLGSNTITVSNFSRGVRLMFGDLVLTTDNGQRALSRLRRLTSDESTSRRFRLAGLRKVLREHTYEERLRFVAGHVWGATPPPRLPRVCVVTFASSKRDADMVVANFRRQEYADKRLVLMCAGFDTKAYIRADVQAIAVDASEATSLPRLMGDASHLAVFSPRDYYGRNYLMDLALATLYSSAAVLGKAARYRSGAAKAFSLLQDGAQYRPTNTLLARAALAHRSALPSGPALSWLRQLDLQRFEASEQLAIDEFNYCEDGAELDSSQRTFVEDLADLDHGLSLDDLRRADQGPALNAAAAPTGKRPHIDAAKLAALFRSPRGKPLALALEGEHLAVQSTLPDETHEYLYAREAWLPSDLGLPEIGKLHFEASPGLNIQLGVLFLDESKKRLGHKLCQAGANETLSPPEGTALVQLALRVYGAGSSKLSGVLLDHARTTPDTLFGRSKYLLVTNRYPSDQDLYRNGFVHRRVLEYRQRGTPVDVFRMGSSDKLGYHEFDGVDVISGGTSALDALLRSNDYEAVLVHFLDARIWQSLVPYLESRRVLIWAHGAEVQSWHRRQAHFPTPAALAAAQAEAEPRRRFWSGVFEQLRPSSKVIFVSRQFADEVLQDLETQVPETRYDVIHNVIDTNLFDYVPKDAEQRKRILSLRPYTSRIYGNDLAVSAILALSGYPFFSELEFHLVGDGPLFEETLAPLRDFPNVRLDKRFLHQNEIAALHKHSGVFLCPSRGDTQGVSRDEAMASGLVPVTNAAGAIPEFVDANCGIVVAPEDALGLAAGIARLYGDPHAFLELSEAAGKRVRRQSGPQHTTAREIALIRGEKA